MQLLRGIRAVSPKEIAGSAHRQNPRLLQIGRVYLLLPAGCGCAARFGTRRASPMHRPRPRITRDLSCPGCLGHGTFPWPSAPKSPWK
jgi:hypothetical protein